MTFLSVLLDIDGDGGGSVDANVDGSSVQKVFKSGAKVVLAGAGDSLQVTIDDDLTGLTGHTFCVQGTARQLSHGVGAATDRFQGVAD